MSAGKIFISHTAADDAIVKQICEALEGQGLPTRADSRELTAGVREPWRPPARGKKPEKRHGRHSRGTHAHVRSVA